MFTTLSTCLFQVSCWWSKSLTSGETQSASGTSSPNANQVLCKCWGTGLYVRVVLGGSDWGRFCRFGARFWGRATRESARALFGELQPGENSSYGFNYRGTRGDPLPLQQLHSTLSKQIWHSYTSRDFYFTVLVKLYHRLGVWFIVYCIYRTCEISLSFYTKSDYKCTARTRKICSILSTRSGWNLVQSLKRRHKMEFWSVGLLSIVEPINDRRWVIERNSIW